MDVTSLRVRSTHELRRSLSRRSEISSMGEWLLRVGATGSMGVVFRSLSRLCGFVCFSRLGLFGAYLDFGL